MKYGNERGVQLYYTIHTVLEIPGLDIPKLNMMERSFPEFLQPEKNRAGKRVYKYREYLYIHWIQKWLEEEILSIEEIRDRLKQVQEKKIPKRPPAGVVHTPQDFGIDLPDYALTPDKIFPEFFQPQESSIEISSRVELPLSVDPISDHPQNNLNGYENFDKNSILAQLREFKSQALKIKNALQT